MATTAGFIFVVFIKDKAVQGDPVWIFVRIWLATLVNRDQGDQIIGAGDDRDSVTQVAFQTNSRPRSIQVLAVVAAKTARIGFVAHIVGVCIPANFLFGEDTLGIYLL